MNLDILKGKWHVLRGRIRSRWGRLTNDDLDRLEGGLEQLGGLVQQRYGLQRDQAEKETEEFFESCEDLVAMDDASEAEAEQR